MIDLHLITTMWPAMSLLSQQDARQLACQFSRRVLLQHKELKDSMDFRLGLQALENAEEFIDGKITEKELDEYHKQAFRSYGNIRSSDCKIPSKLPAIDPRKIGYAIVCTELIPAEEAIKLTQMNLLSALDEGGFSWLDEFNWQKMEINKRIQHGSAS